MGRPGGRRGRVAGHDERPADDGHRAAGVQSPCPRGTARLGGRNVAGTPPARVANRDRQAPSRKTRSVRNMDRAFFARARPGEPVPSGGGDDTVRATGTGRRRPHRRGLDPKGATATAPSSRLRPAAHGVVRGHTRHRRCRQRRSPGAQRTRMGADQTRDLSLRQPRGWRSANRGSATVFTRRDNVAAPPSTHSRGGPSRKAMPLCQNASRAFTAMSGRSVKNPSMPVARNASTSRSPIAIGSSRWGSPRGGTWSPRGTSSRARSTPRRARRRRATPATLGRARGPQENRP